MTAEAGPTLADVLAEIEGLKASLSELHAKFDAVDAQVRGIAEIAGPAVNQLVDSPLMRMLGGKRRAAG